MPLPDALQIASSTTGQVLTPEQKRFNTLIRQIDQARKNLAAWHAQITLYRLAHARVILPLQSAFADASRQWVFALDGLLDQPGWSRADRETLATLLCETAGELLDADDDDAALKALFAKHHDVDFDTGRQQMLHAMKALTETLTGLDLGPADDVHSDADLFQRVEEELQAQAAAAAAQREARAQRRRKTAAQQRRDAEAQQATQSVREIFRKLASALHPDRETDPEQQRNKTLLMQQVNQAYAANDLLTLLELQLKIEQVDAGRIANAGAQRLKHYNKMLATQLSELKAESEQVELGFRLDFGLEPGWGLQPSHLGGLVDQQGKQLRAELAQLQRDHRMLADRAATRRWLKRQRQELRNADFSFDVGFG